MLKIGVTGGIGSGKTVVCEIFKILGVPVYNADEAAKKLIQTDPEIINNFTGRYGDDIYVNGELDRKKLSQLIFDNKEELNFVNSTVHPRVFAHFDEWLELHKNQKYIIKEAALIFESGSSKELDKVILVTTSVNERIKRVVERDKATEEAVKKIILSQMSDEEKIEKADFIINNEGNDLIIPQILKLHKRFLNN